VTTYNGANVQFTIGGTQYTYNLNGSNSTGNLWAVQNVTPTFVQAKAGSSVDNEVQPFAEIAYSDWTGSIGLSERTNDPGDFSRPFLSSLDHSRARQLTGRATGANGTNIDTPIDRTTVGNSWAWVEGNAGPGFVGRKKASTTYAYYLWDAPTRTFKWQRDVYFQPQVLHLLSSNTVSRAVTGSMHYPFQQVVQYGTHLYMATSTGTGLTDINVAAAAPVGAAAVSGCVMACKFFDQLVTFSFSGGNIVVQCLSGEPVAVTQSIAADGTRYNNTCTLYGECSLMGAVAWRGVLYVFTDRSLYTLQWIEATNTFVVEPQILNTGKFTSNPVVFASELWVGSDNQLWHLQAGATNNDFKLIDDEGWLPAPYNGRITELHPFTQTLVAKVVRSDGALTYDAAVFLRYTTLGSWQYLGNPFFTTTGDTVMEPNTIALPIRDGTNRAMLCYFQNAFGDSVEGFIIFESGANVRTLSFTSAITTAGLHITPWEYGQNRTSQKQLLRSRLEVDQFGVNVAGSGNVWPTVVYQRDTENKAADNFATIVSGVLGGTNPQFGFFGTGAWTLAQTSGASATGDVGSALSSAGNGVLWREFDGSGGEHGAVAYPSFKRLRWMYYVPGSNAAPVPALLSHSWQRLEYAFKFYVINTMLKLECNLDQPNSPGLYSTPDQLVAAVQVLQAADYGKAIITAVGPDAQSYTCVISKFLSNYTVLDHDGPKQAIVQLTLQSVKLYGLAI
jgi:hypothetical protein